MNPTKRYSNIFEFMDTLNTIIRKGCQANPSILMKKFCFQSFCTDTFSVHVLRIYNLHHEMFTALNFTENCLQIKWIRNCQNPLKTYKKSDCL